MKFDSPLIDATFLRRYKRFFADVEIDGRPDVALVPNTGSLKTCLEAGQACRLSESTNPDRKLKYTLEFLQGPSSWIGVNTSLSNRLVEEGCWNGSDHPAWRQFEFCQREAKIHRETRLDFVLWSGGPGGRFHHDWLNDPTFRGHFVEVKNVTMVENDTAFFPDAVTTRGQKHLKDLMDLMERGHGAELVFTIQRSDCVRFRPAVDIDPEYGHLLKEAKKRGLIITPLVYCLVDEEVRALTSRRPNVDL